MKLFKSLLKNSAHGFRISIISCIISLFIATGFIHNNLGSSTTSPVTSDTLSLARSLNRPAPDGYVKPSYTVNDHNSNANLTSNDITSSEAAEIMSQEIYRYYKLNISGKTLDLTYQKPTITNKSSWIGELYNTPYYSINIQIDSITGELNTIHRTFIKSPFSTTDQSKKGYDFDIEQCHSLTYAENKLKANLTDNCTKVKEMITSADLLPEAIKKCTYKSTGVSVPYTGSAGHEKPLGRIVSHDFDVQTVSDKIYRFNLSEDLSSIEGMESPDFVLAFDHPDETYDKDMTNPAP